LRFPDCISDDQGALLPENSYAEHDRILRVVSADPAGELLFGCRIRKPVHLLPVLKREEIAANICAFLFVTQFLKDYLTFLLPIKHLLQCTK